MSFQRKRFFHKSVFKTEGYSLKNTRGPPDVKETWHSYQATMKKKGPGIVAIADHEFKEARKNLYPTSDFMVLVRRRKK